LGLGLRNSGTELPRLCTVAALPQASAMTHLAVRTGPLPWALMASRPTDDDDVSHDLSTLLDAQRKFPRLQSVRVEVLSYHVFEMFLLDRWAHVPALDLHVHVGHFDRRDAVKFAALANMRTLRLTIPLRDSTPENRMPRAWLPTLVEKLPRATKLLQLCWVWSARLESRCPEVVRDTVSAANAVVAVLRVRFPQLSVTEDDDLTGLTHERKKTIVITTRELELPCLPSFLEKLMLYWVRVYEEILVCAAVPP